MNEVQNKYIFNAYVDDIECIDDECVIFSVKSKFELPTTHCYINNALLKRCLIVITPGEYFKFTTELSKERNCLEISSIQHLNNKKERTIVADLKISPIVSNKQVKEPFEILINNTPAFISKKCKGNSFLCENEKYKFTYRKNMNRLEIISFSKIFHNYTDEQFYDDLLTDEEEMIHSEHVELCKKKIGNMPGLKVKLRGTICSVQNNKEFFYLQDANNARYKCVFVKSRYSSKFKELQENECFIVEGILAGGVVYMTHIERQRKHMRKNLFIVKKNTNRKP